MYVIRALTGQRDTLLLGSLILNAPQNRLWMDHWLIGKLIYFFLKSRTRDPDWLWTDCTMRMAFFPNDRRYH